MNIDVSIIRSIDNGVQTTGKLYITGDISFACDTLERPWKDNKPGISCIAPNVYICKKVDATEHIPYPHISVTNVSGRDGICIHIFNEYLQSLGCIGVGKGFGDINNDGQVDILNSGNTFKELMRLLPDEFNLTITEAQYKPLTPTV